MIRKTRLLRRTAGVVTAVGMALLLSGCVIVPTPYHHHYGYYGWR